jgi:pyruvate formate lyase activating enzyme
MQSRREFLALACRSVPLAGTVGISCSAGRFLPFFSAPTPLEAAGEDVTAELLKNAPLARYWISTVQAGKDCTKCHSANDKLSGQPHDAKQGLIKCLLCAQGCALRMGERGRCRARINVGGELRSLVYGRPVAIHVDPIEKKPFYHFLPGSDAFSLATAGCPLRCKFCQNWQISQSRPEDHPGRFTPPTEIVNDALSSRAPVIAFTYNEPTVFTEYLTDITRLARQQKMRCVLISCGFMNAEPLAEMVDVLQAIKIDLKGFDNDFYRNVCNAELKPVLRSIKQIARSGVHLEIVNLVVPTLNDSETMLRALADWIVGELGNDVPVHFTRFHPDFQLLNLPPTPAATLDRARSIAMDRGVHYAFVGNIPDHPGNHTYCPGCKKVVIKRNAFFVVEMDIKDGKCKYCGRRIAGVWT